MRGRSRQIAHALLSIIILEETACARPALMMILEETDFCHCSWSGRSRQMAHALALHYILIISPNVIIILEETAALSAIAAGGRNAYYAQRHQFEQHWE